MLEFGDTRLPDRFWDKVHPEPSSGCWLWDGGLNSKSRHPYFCYESRIFTVHKFISERFMGMTEKERSFLSCDNKLCVNPKHIVIQDKNICIRGHNGPRDSFGNCKPCKNEKRRLERQMPHNKEKRRVWERDYYRRRKEDGYVRVRTRSSDVSVFGDKPPEQPWRPNAPGW